MLRLGQSAAKPLRTITREKLYRVLAMASLWGRFNDLIVMGVRELAALCDRLR
jgi:hypothetical protein